MPIQHSRWRYASSSLANRRRNYSLHQLGIFVHVHYCSVSPPVWNTSMDNPLTDVPCQHLLCSTEDELETQRPTSWLWHICFCTLCPDPWPVPQNHLFKQAPKPRTVVFTLVKWVMSVRGVGSDMLLCGARSPCGKTWKIFNFYSMLMGLVILKYSLTCTPRPAGGRAQWVSCWWGWGSHCCRCIRCCARWSPQPCTPPAGGRTRDAAWSIAKYWMLARQQDWADLADCDSQHLLTNLEVFDRWIVCRWAAAQE